jgi:hypothetical protein
MRREMAQSQAASGGRNRKDEVSAYRRVGVSASLENLGRCLQLCRVKIGAKTTFSPKVVQKISAMEVGVERFKHSAPSP